MRTTLILIGGIGVLVAGFLACGDDTGSAPPDYSQLLQGLTTNVILPENDALASSADALATALRALESTPNADTLAKAQAAWRAARTAYRHLDAVHIGPIADLGISDRIDLAPAKGGDIDAIIAAATPIDAAAIGKAGGHAKGFLGIEYLIFSSKGPAAALALLQGDGAPARRRTLARSMADEIATSAHQLVDAWTPGKGGYANEITGAGSTSTHYPSQRAALDDIVGGVGFAFEVVVGVRLSAPLGRQSGGTPNPALDPTAASDSAAADIKASVEGIQALYNGAGLSARVRTRSTTLDDRIASQINDCAAKVAAIPPPFDVALTTATASVQASYEACKTAKGTWNTDVTSALGATLKPSDNDGD